MSSRVLTTITMAFTLAASIPACSVEDTAPRGVELQRAGDAAFSEVVEDLDGEQKVLIALDGSGAAIGALRPTLRAEGIELGFDVLDAVGSPVTLTLFVAADGVGSYAELADASGTRRWDDSTDGGTIDPQLQAILTANMTQWRDQLDARPELRQHFNASDDLKFRGSFWCHLGAVAATAIVCGAFHIVPVAGVACDIGVGYLIDEAIEAKYDC